MGRRAAIKGLLWGWLQGPPFYGAMIMGNLPCALDGLRINTGMQALDTEGKPIAPVLACR